MAPRQSGNSTPDPRWLLHQVIQDHRRELESFARSVMPSPDKQSVHTAVANALFAARTYIDKEKPFPEEPEDVYKFLAQNLRWRGKDLIRDWVRWRARNAPFNETTLANNGLGLRPNVRRQPAPGTSYFDKYPSDNPDYVEILDDLGVAIENLGSPRDQEILFMTADGYTTSQIADIYGLSKGRVRKIRGEIRNRFKEIEARLQEEDTKGGGRDD